MLSNEDIVMSFLLLLFLKVFIEFVTILLLFSVLGWFFFFFFFGHEACGILVPQPGIKPSSPALEDELLTTGPPGNL